MYALPPYMLPTAGGYMRNSRGVLFIQVFPRPLLDSALEIRRSEREEATREVKAQIKKMRPNSKALGSPGEQLQT